MLVKMICPQCGATLDMDDSREFIFCRFCGTKILNTAQKIEVKQDVNVSGMILHRTDYSNEPNLVINYSSSNISVKMVVNILSLRTKLTFINGQSMTFYLPEGRNEIVLKIGKKNYRRFVIINSHYPPVKIHASWSKHAQIYIESPFPQ